MGKIDKVFETWHKMDEVYAVKGRGEPKLDFLSKFVTQKALTTLRGTVMSDFVESQEAIDKLNLLFKTLEALPTKIALANDLEPDSLEEFIWADSQKPVYVSLDDFVQGFRPLVGRIKESSVSELVDSSIFRNRFSLECDGSVAARVIPHNLEKMIHFETEVDVVFWLNFNAKEINSKNSFQKMIYAFVLDSLVRHKDPYPITFIKNEAGGKNFDGEIVSLSGKFKTLSGIPFTCETKVRECNIENGFTTDKVVIYGQI